MPTTTPEAQIHTCHVYNILLTYCSRNFKQQPIKQYPLINNQYLYALNEIIDNI